MDENQAIADISTDLDYSIPKIPRVIDSDEESEPERNSLSEMARTALAAAASGLLLSGGEEERSLRCSLTAFWSLNSDLDLGVDDELTRTQRTISELKDYISQQSKKNFILEREVKDLDSRIALLIHNHMTIDDHQGFASILSNPEVTPEAAMRDPRLRQLYGGLFFLLQTEPKCLASILRNIKFCEMDSFLETVMFTIYGNQYDLREEYLLLNLMKIVLTGQWEVSLNSDTGDILRANTPLTRMITAYTRRGSGQSYLKMVLSSTIKEVISKEEYLEVNPNYLSSTENIDAIVSQNAKRLTELTSGCLKKIMNNVDSVPYGIRWICKQIRSLAKRSLQQPTDEDVCILLGSVFFLRFVNPVITVPNSSGLVSTPVKKNQQRTLTLISKLIQSISNKPATSREDYMLPLADFVDGMKAPMRRFLSELCNVSDFYESLEIQNYIALSKGDLKISITLNEIYKLHSLICTYRDKLGLENDKRLDYYLTSLGPPHLPLPPSEDKRFTLDLVQWLPNYITDPANTELIRREIVYMDTKLICIQIFRLVPSIAQSVGLFDPKQDELDLNKVSSLACSLKSSSVAKKGLRLKGLASELDKMYETKCSQTKACRQIMFEEVKNELEFLGDLKDKLKSEIKNLEEVLQNLQGQHSFLMGQLKSYKAYLQNVRVQFAPYSSNRNKVYSQQTTIKISYSSLEKDGTIVASRISDIHKSSTYFTFQAPVPGKFVIAVHYAHRSKPILEMELSLDDLLRKKRSGDSTLDLETVHLNVTNVLKILSKNFFKK